MTGEIPDCKLCGGGCCEGDAKLFGFLRSDLPNLAIYNPVTVYPPGSYPDLKAMYHDLKSGGAPDGFYILKNDPVIQDIDGIRIGACKACVDGICLLEENKPHPCRIMELAGRVCTTIFLRRISSNLMIK
jgi:hypothetical protein